MLHKPLTMLLLGALLMLSVGCQTTDTGGTEVCTVWRPVTWSQKDTPETVDGVKGNNGRRQAYCGG